ncbi:MAG: homoserine O-acetyltransferase [Planctomycetes bacterium]|nr:homoserine O-acetyltransferase [Planctomycetota bacterium]
MMHRDSVGVVEAETLRLVEPPDGLPLDGGGILTPVVLAYETYGILSSERDNAVLVCHALSGSAHAAGFHRADDPKPGWWETAIGPGKAFDTDEYFVICSNVIGGCSGSTGPASLDPGTGRPYGMRFPLVTIGDMVRAQKRLIDHLGIPRLLAVAGGSMGGMQAIQWMLAFPDLVASAIPIATTAKLSAQGIAFDAVGREAIVTDPEWKDGDYYGGKGPANGLAIARMIGHITYLSDEAMHRKFGRRRRDGLTNGSGLAKEFEVEGYLERRGASFIHRFDANSYLYITKAIDCFDPALEHGSLVKAFSRVKARVLVISFSSDWLFPTYHSKEIVRALEANGADSSFCEIRTSHGHDAFLLECPEQTELIRGFLRRVRRESGA